MNETLESKKSPFDYERFLGALEIIRKHNGIENMNQLAKIIGINHSSLYGMLEGKTVDALTLFKIVHWSKLDIREYMSDYVAPAWTGIGSSGSGRQWNGDHTPV